MEFPVLLLVPFISHTFTFNCKKSLGPSSSWSSWRQQWKSPHLPSLLISTQNNPALSFSSYTTCSSPLIISIALQWVFSSMHASFLYCRSPKLDTVVQHRCWTQGNNHNYFPQPADYTFANTAWDMVGHFLDCTLLTHVQLVFTWTPFLPVRTQPQIQVSVLTFVELHGAPVSPFPQPDKAHSGSTYPIVYLSNPYFTSLATRIPWVYSTYNLVSNDPEVEQSVNNFCAAFLSLEY